MSTVHTPPTARAHRPYTPPWEARWCKVHKITKPMFVVLYDAAERESLTVHQLYPYGQWRLISTGLFRRGLIDGDELTMCGYVLAIWALLGVRRYWPMGTQL